MAENHHLLHPLLLLPSSNTTNEIFSSPEHVATVPPPLDCHKTTSSKYGIVLRFALLMSIGIVSIWANHEASKGFAITIVNESGDKRFQLFYVSNDEATRMIIRASKNVEKFLYHDDDGIHTKKEVKHVILKFASQNLTGNVDVDSVTEKEFVMVINPKVMESTNFSHVMSQVVQQGMVRIWIWGGQGTAPKNLIEGIVEYVTSKLRYSHLSSNSEPLEPAFMCNWKHEDPSTVANFLDYCERSRPGFIRRLNQGMKDEWHDGKFEMALGLPLQNLCARNGSTTFTA